MKLNEKKNMLTTKKKLFVKTIGSISSSSFACLWITTWSNSRKKFVLQTQKIWLIFFENHFYIILKWIKILKVQNSNWLFESRSSIVGWFAWPWWRWCFRAHFNVCRWSRTLDRNAIAIPCTSLWTSLVLVYIFISYLFFHFIFIFFKKKYDRMVCFFLKKSLINFLFLNPYFSNIAFARSENHANYGRFAFNWISQRSCTPSRSFVSRQTHSLCDFVRLLSLGQTIRLSATRSFARRRLWVNWKARSRSHGTHRTTRRWRISCIFASYSQYNLVNQFKFLIFFVYCFVFHCFMFYLFFVFVFVCVFVFVFLKQFFA